MKWFLILVGISIFWVHLEISPCVLLTKEHCDQFCLAKGCTREVVILTENGCERELASRTIPNCLSSYSLTVLGPCSQHEWVTYHGGGSKYFKGIRSFFSGTENFTFSGTTQAAIPLGVVNFFSSLNIPFRYLLRRDPETLKQILTLLLSRMRSVNWEGEFDFIYQVETQYDNPTGLASWLTALEKSP